MFASIAAILLLLFALVGVSSFVWGGDFGENRSPIWSVVQFSFLCLAALAARAAHNNRDISDNKEAPISYTWGPMSLLIVGLVILLSVLMWVLYRKQ